MKSLQLLLNEVFGQLALDLVTHSAFTQARSHLKHTAFMELNQKTIVAEYYHDAGYQRYSISPLINYLNCVESVELPSATVESLTKKAAHQEQRQRMLDAVRNPDGSKRELAHRERKHLFFH